MFQSKLDYTISYDLSLQGLIELAVFVSTLLDTVDLLIPISTVGVVLIASAVSYAMNKIPLESKLRAQRLPKKVKKERDNFQRVDLRGIKVNMEQYPNLNWHINSGYYGFIYDEEDRTLVNALMMGMMVTSPNSAIEGSSSFSSTSVMNVRATLNTGVVDGYTGVRREMKNVRSNNPSVLVTFNSTALVAFGIHKVFVNGRAPEWTHTGNRSSTKVSVSI